LNAFEAKAKWQDGSWRALVRYVHRGTFFPVMDGDRPAGFPTKLEAELEAHRELTRHMNTTIRSWGERVGCARAAADKLFAKNGRQITVEVRGA
jgi:hypothetical protein